MNGFENFIFYVRNLVSMFYIPVLLFGGLNCFFGYKIFRFKNVMVGAFSGGVFGALAGAIISGGTNHYLAILLTATVLAGVGALLANALVVFFIFFKSFFIGTMASAVLMITFDFTDELVGMSVVCGLLFGVISCIAYKHMIIFDSAFEGAISIGTAVGVMLANRVSGICITLLYFTAGLYLQNYLSKKKMAASKDEVKMDEPSMEHEEEKCEEMPVLN